MKMPKSKAVTVGLLAAALISGVPRGGRAGSDASANRAISAPAGQVKYSVPVMDFGAVAADAPVSIVFHPTALVANSRGGAEVRLDRGVMKIHATFSQLPPASQFGRGDLAYVLWSITAEGRATNHGEITPNGSQGEIDAKVEWRRFGILITAEPYFAVSRPSATVVFVGGLAQGSASQVPVTEASCSLLSRPSQRTAASDPTASSEPLIFAEARRAIAAARDAGAPKYAPLTFGTCTQLLQLAETQLAHGVKMKDVLDTGSEAVLIAEDARVLATARQKREHDADPAPAP